MYAEVSLEPSIIFTGVSLRKSQRSFVVDVQLGSKYAFHISLTVEKVYRMLVFV